MPLYGESELSRGHRGSLRGTADALINSLSGTEFKSGVRRQSSKKCLQNMTRLCSVELLFWLLRFSIHRNSWRACCTESFSGRLFYKSAVNQQADLSTDFCETPYLFAFACRRSVSQLCACVPRADAVSEAVVHQSRGRPAGLQDPAHAVG